MSEEQNTDLIMEKEFRRAFASSGGRATSEKYGKDHFRKLALKSWENRRKDKNENNTAN